MLGESQRNARNICPIGQTAPITTRWWSAGLLELSGACWHFLLQIVIDVPLDDSPPPVNALYNL